MKKKHQRSRKKVHNDIENSDYELKQLQLRLMTLSQDKAKDSTRAGIMAQMAIIYWREYDADASLNLWKRVETICREQKEYGLLTITGIGMAGVYGQIDEVEKAFEYANLTLELEPENPDSMFAMANCYSHAGDLENARIWYHRTIEAAPDFTFGIESLADAYAHDNQYTEAQIYFDMALKISPDSSSAYLLLGNMQSAQERYDEALENFKMAVKFNGESAIPHNNLGNCHLRMGQREKAHRCFKKAIEIDDNDTLYPNVAMGVLYRSHSNPKAQEKSREFFEKALEIFKIGKCRLKAEWMVYDSRGAIILTGLGDEEALPMWRRLLATVEPRHMEYAVILDCVHLVGMMAQCNDPPSDAQAAYILLEDALEAHRPKP